MSLLLEYLNTSFYGAVLVFLFGLIWGSFFNVCIARIPEDETVISGRSHCPKCKHEIPWYLNIPVLSYLFLLGKCRFCRTKISIQYPLVEVSTGLLFLSLFYEFGLGRHFVAYAIFVSLLLVISVIDLHHQIIPDELSLPGIVLGVLACWLTRDIFWWESGLGIVLGGGIFLAIAWIYEKLTGREGLGGGDVKLLAMIGAWLGYQSLPLVILLSSASGSVVGLFIIWLKKKDRTAAIPFGPFLALGALLYLFFGTRLRTLLFPSLP